MMFSKEPTDNKDEEDEEEEEEEEEEEKDAPSATTIPAAPSAAPGTTTGVLGTPATTGTTNPNRFTSKPITTPPTNITNPEINETIRCKDKDLATYYRYIEDNKIQPFVNSQAARTWDAERFPLSKVKVDDAKSYYCNTFNEDPEKIYAIRMHGMNGRIKTFGGSKCLDIPRGNHDKDVVMEMHDCHGQYAFNQNFIFDWHKLLYNEKTGKCYGIEWAGRQGSRLIQHDCPHGVNDIEKDKDNVNQVKPYFAHFAFDYTKHAELKPRHANGELCLQYNSGPNTITAENCNKSNNNQKWYFD